MFGDAGELLDGQRLAAGLRRDTRGDQRGLRGGGRSGPPRQRGPQRLAALGEGRVDDGEDLVAARRGLDRLVAADEGDQSGVDVGGGPEDVAADGAGPLDLGVPVGLHRRHAVDLVAGAGGEPVGDLGLDHDQGAVDGGERREHVQQHRHGDVVREVGDQRGGRGAGQLGDVHRVTVHQREAVGAVGHPGRDGVRQRGGQHLVDLDGGDPVGGLQQAQGQRAEARADLDHDIVGPDLGGPDDPADGVGVDDEILAALLGGADAQRGGQLADVGGAQQGAWIVGGALAHATASLRSFTREAYGRRPATGSPPSDVELLGAVGLLLGGGVLRAAVAAEGPPGADIELVEPAVGAGGVHGVRPPAGLALCQRVPGEVVGAAHGGGQLPDAEVHDLRARGAHDLAVQPLRPLFDAVDGAHPVGDPPDSWAPLLDDDHGAAGQAGIGPVDGAEGDGPVADLLGAGDPQHREGLAVVREALRRHRGGVLVAQCQPGLGQGLADGGGVGAEAVRAAVGDDRHRAFGTDRQLQTALPDAPRAGGRHIGAVGPYAELVEGAGDGVGGGPHRAALSVDAQHDRAAVPDDDLVTAAEGGAGGGRDDVVGADVQPFVGQQVVDVGGEGVQGARAAVDGEPDRLVVGDEGGGAAGEEGDDQGPRQQLAQRFGAFGAASATAARGAVAALRMTHGALHMPRLRLTAGM